MSCVSPGGILWHGRHWLQCKKRIVDRISDEIQTHLNVVQELMQPAFDDLADLDIVEIGAYTTQLLFGHIGECADGSAGDQMQRQLRRLNTVSDRARKFPI